MQAIGNCIIVKQEKPEERNSLGMIIPDKFRRYKPFAKVVSFGKKVEGLQVGDEILMVTAEPENRVEHEGETYSIIDPSYVECKIDDKKLIPIDDRVILILDDPENVTKGGIFIPDTALESKLSGEIIWVGDTCEEVQEGDIIHFSRFSGKTIMFYNTQYTIVKESDIQYKIKDDTMIPLNNNIVVEQEKGKTHTESGIILNPFNIDSLRPNVGNVIAKGKKVEEFDIDERVFFSMYAGRKLKWKEKDYILLRETEIMAQVPTGVEISGGFTQDHNEIAESLSHNEMLNNLTDEEEEKNQGDQ